MLISKLCNEADYRTDWFAAHCAALRQPVRYHRKYWEWAFIYQALVERGLLAPGKRGLGFGVGREPLAAAFAAQGCQITATDLDPASAAAQGWVESQQHAPHLEALNELGLCDPDEFHRLVTFEYADMNQIDPRYAGQFDFTWSSCSFDHCGSIGLGQHFVMNQMHCLRPGGVAVHTTEFNLSSNDATLDDASVVLFRRRDIETLVYALRDHGYVIDIDLTPGTGPIETFVDVPPYQLDPHLRLQFANYVTTSIGLIILKP